MILAGKLHKQQRGGPASDDAIDRRTECRNGVRQVEHGAVQQFHRGRAEFHDVARHFHGVIKSIKMADGLDLMLGNAVQLEFDFCEESERTFRADKDFRQVQRRAAHHEEVVAANLTHQPGDAELDLLRVVAVERAQRRSQFRKASRLRIPVLGNFAEHVA